MSTTPRTDEQVMDWTTEDGSDIVFASMARELETELAAMTARAEKAEADTARLDWLEANPEAIRAYSIYKSTFGRKVWWETGFGNYHTAREAINAGMKEDENDSI